MMLKAIEFSGKEYTEIVELRKGNKEKNIERRLRVQMLQRQGMSYNEIYMMFCQSDLPPIPESKSAICSLVWKNESSVLVMTKTELY